MASRESVRQPLPIEFRPKYRQFQHPAAAGHRGARRIREATVEGGEGEGRARSARHSVAPCDSASRARKLRGAPECCTRTSQTARKQLLDFAAQLRLADALTVEERRPLVTRQLTDRLETGPAGYCRKEHCHPSRSDQKGRAPDGTSIWAPAPEPEWPWRGACLEDRRANRRPASRDGSAQD